MNEANSQNLPPIGSRVPLLFTFRDTVFGNGFLAEVRAQHGRAIGVHEADGFWMYGINPGGMAAHGASPQDVLIAFRKTFANVLVDLARESRTFEDFRAAVESFFHQTNEGYEPDWREAVKDVREGRILTPGLQRTDADSPRSITVEIKDVFRVEDNRPQVKAKVAA